MKLSESITSQHVVGFIAGSLTTLTIQKILKYRKKDSNKGSDDSDE